MPYSLEMRTTGDRSDSEPEDIGTSPPDAQLLQHRKQLWDGIQCTPRTWEVSLAAHVVVKPAAQGSFPYGELRAAQTQAPVGTPCSRKFDKNKDIAFARGRGHEVEGQMEGWV